MSNQRKPLEGVKVIELANYVAAPIVGRICADLGAEVIKIEGRGGDAWRATTASIGEVPQNESPLFDAFNVGKKTISLNMKTENGMKVFYKMLDEADIFLTNTRDKSLVKLGIDYDSIKEKYPRLIYCTLTGYGYEGPDCDAPGYDNVAFWSRTGFAADMYVKSQGSYPVNSRYAMGDTITGTTAFGALMTALYQREKTGKGDFVTMSLYGAGIWAFGGGVVMAQKPICHPFPEKRAAKAIATNISYECADEEWIRCTIFEFDRYTPQFFDALGVTEEMNKLGIVSTDAMLEKVEQVIPILEKAFLKKPSYEWLKVLSDLDIVCGKLNHFADVLEDEQAWANGYIQKYKCPSGAERIIPTCPVRLGSCGPITAGAPMLYKQHNNEVLKDLGYSENDIQAFEKDGTLG